MRLLTLASAAFLFAATAPGFAQQAVDSSTILKSLTSHPANSADASSEDDDGGAAVDPKSRGIKHKSATDQSTTAMVAGTAPASSQPSASLLVLFASGSADLTDAGRAQLNQLGGALKTPELAGKRFRIEGHTDTQGDAQSNLALSQRRANAVVAYLTAQFGLDAKQFMAVGMGKQGLAIATPDQTAEPRNRRVVVINLDG